MSFLDSLIKDPKYQSHDPRTPEEITEPEIIISPDTRRENRIPPGQSRTKRWPVHKWKEFCSKMEGSLQEADESQLWLELLRDDCAVNNMQINHLHGEANELLAIFATMVAKIRRD